MSNEIGKFIRKKRKEAKITLKQLEDKSGVSYTYISTLETGKRGNPSAEVLNKIAGVLGIPSVEILTVAGYLKAKKVEEHTFMEYEKVKIDRINPLELLTMLKPDLLLNIFTSYVKMSGMVVSPNILTVLQEGITKDLTTEDIVDMVVVNHKELLHIYVFMAAIANYNGKDMSNDVIWAYFKKLPDTTGIVEDALDFEVFNLWHKHYFKDDILTDYGDYKLRNTRDFTFDVSPILENDTVIINGRILNQKVLMSIRALLID